MWYFAAQQACNIGNGNQSAANDEGNRGPQVKFCGPQRQPAGVCQVCRVVDGQSIASEAEDGDAAEQRERSDGDADRVDHGDSPGLLAEVGVIGVNFIMRRSSLVLERGVGERTGRHDGTRRRTVLLFGREERKERRRVDAKPEPGPRRKQ